MSENGNAIETKAYLPLKDFRFEIGAAEEEEEEAGGSGFSFCFWVYLPNSTPFPSVITHQVNAQIKEGTPLLALNEMKKLVLFPLLPSQSEALDLHDTSLWNEIPHASMASEFPLAKWTHIGCEVSTDRLQLRINDELGDEKFLNSSITEDQGSSVLKTLTLFCTNDNNVAAEGYVYKPMERATLSSIKDDYYMDSPVHLSIDNSSASDIEEDIDGVWSIIGGKASCRRNFSLDVVLLDAFAKSVDKEIEVAASLVYADNGAPVEKTSDGEAPLLTTYDGMEFDSCDRPSKLLHGRASFKLKISQLSSKCDNRLFRIRFQVLEAGNYPFLEASSLPIRCISRNRTSKPSSLIIWKRPNPGNFSATASNSHSSRVNDRFLELQRNTVREGKPGPLSKRVKLVNDTFEQPDDEGNSHARDSVQRKNGFQTCSKMKAETSDVADKSQSDSDSTKVKTLTYKSIPCRGKAVPDLTIFRYCLGGIAERTILLKDIASSASNEEVLEFADQVSLYSGCSHHRNQIIVARRLIDEGKTFWNMVSHDHQSLYWDSMVLEIEEHFKKITCCSTRSLTQQDFEVLRRIAGCRDMMTQEHFEKMWCWLYPVAFTLSRHKVRDMWSCTSPYWIEGFITKEEAELSLQGPSGLQEPGTFILRFPTSRSWPHPDAGSLVVTYVGSDYSLHHKLLAFDHLYSGEGDKGTRTLPEMLLAETELSHLGRMLRIR